MIIFIIPPGPKNIYRGMVCSFVSKARYLWQPYDFINLSAQIPADQEVKLIDCSINNYNTDYLYEQIKTLCPSLCIIAISSIIFDQDMLFLSEFRARFPDVKFLVTGNILLEDFFWDRILGHADGLLLNSLDIDLLAYIKCSKSNSNNFIDKNKDRTGQLKFPDKQTVREVSIGIPRHKVFIDKRYHFPFARSNIHSTVTTQFGCPFQCSYCSWAKVPVSYRSYMEVLEELTLVNRLGVRDVFFTDPSFGFPRENAILLLEGMIRKGLDIQWSCYANPLLLDRSFLRLLKRSGCHTLITGIDDADFNMLDKKFNRHISESQIAEFCQNCHDLDLRVCGDFIIGLNTEKKAFDLIVNLAKKLNLDYASFNIFSVLVGSVVREQLVKEGKFDPSIPSVDPSGHYGQIDRRLACLRNLAVRKFYLRPKYIFNRILAIRSFSEFMVQLEEMAVLIKNLLKSQTDA